MTEYIILTCAAFLAGMLNTVAGGGTFLTFPALVYTGVPVVVANATSAIVVAPGYLGGVIGFRKEIRSFDRKALLKTTIVAAFGGLAGSFLLLVSSNELFSVIVPFLLALATLAFAFGESLQKWAHSGATTGRARVIGTTIVSIYGGYFNGGVGIVFLALFSLFGMRDINVMNGLKAVMSFILSVISVAIFAAAGIVAWPQAIVMMAAATVGGYAGAPLARALPVGAIRIVVVVVGGSMSVLFFLRLMG